MSAPETACGRLMRKTFVEGGAAPCRKCFEPTDGPCFDYRLTLPPEDEVEPQASIIQATMEPEPTSTQETIEVEETEPEGQLRQHIDIRAECSKGRPLFGSEADKMRCCTLCVAQEQNLNPNLCSAACRPLRTFLHLNEMTKRPLPKPTFKHAVMLDNNTMAGRCFAIKFQLKRMVNKCLECGRDLYLRHPIANNSDVLLLQNCCDVEVYPAKRVDEMNNVRVTKITGLRKMANSLLKERSECRMFPLPIVLPPIEEPITSRKSSRKSARGSRKSVKGKKKKGK